MRVLRVMWVRLRGLIRSRRSERELADEMASHFELHVDDLVRAGRSPGDARREARLKFGGVEAIKDAQRDRRSVPVIETTMRDVKNGWRVWRRSPGVAAVAVLSLALGIGANTAIFSIVNALVLRPLPVAEPARLVEIFREANRPILSNPIWEQIRNRPDLFARAAAWSPLTVNLASSGAVEPASALWVSGGYFDLLGVGAWRGRLLTDTDDRRGGGADGNVAVISYGFWQRRFGRDDAAIGRAITIEGKSFTVVGVTPPEFFGAEVGRTFDLAIPLCSEALIRPRSLLDEPSGWWLLAMARLRPDQTVETAAAALQGVQPQVRAATLPVGLRPADIERYLRAPMVVRPAATGVSDLRRAYQDPLAIVMVVVEIVLLIACVNLANLLLARADSRRHEMSVRLALGASRGRLIRQLVVETLWLAAASGVVGLVFAEWSGRLLVHQLSTTTNIVSLAMPLDWRVLAFTAGVALLSALAFGLVPAFRATRTVPNDALKAHGRVIADGRWSLGGVLVAMQVALCLVLVVAAGLFLRTFTSLANVRLGFAPEVLTIVDLNATKTATPPAARLALFAQVRDRVRALPGVADAALSSMTPLAGQWDVLIENPEGVTLPEEARDVFVNAVSPDWFHTYGMALHAGRNLEPRDSMPGAVPVIVVNETFARRIFNGTGAVGRTVREAQGQSGQPADWTIIGIVDDAIYDAARSGVPATMYRPQASGTPAFRMSLTVRLAADAPDLSRSIAAAAAGVDDRITMTMQPLSARVSAALTRERILAILSGFFGALALALAALGLYGVVSYAVSRRKMEIGIRMALGATSSGVVRLVMTRVGVIVIAGIVIGGAASVWASRFVASLLFGLEARDAATLGAAIMVLAVVAAMASWLPARRAAKLDPTVVLREG